MVIFLLTFFTIYGGVHAYAFWKAREAFGFGMRAGVPVALVMLFMVLAPILVRVAERAGLEFLPRILAYVGYFWMGALFLFFAASLVFDLDRLFVGGAGLLTGQDMSFLRAPARISFLLCLAWAILITCYGYFEAGNIVSERIEIQTSKIPQEIGRVRIVQISDVHLGLIVREQRLKKILRAVREAGPDLLVSTGDLVDGQMDSLPGLDQLFSDIRPRYGKFAVTGNHEYYAGLGHALDVTKKAGFRILRGEGVTLGGFLDIAGLDDPTGGGGAASEREVLSGLTSGHFTLLLKHRPVLDHEAAGLFDLQLSGHVHKGQIFPFNLLTYLFYPVTAGLSTLENGAYLYVSRGSGTWGPPVRFLAPPEVTVIDLVHG